MAIPSVLVEANTEPAVDWLEGHFGDLPTDRRFERTKFATVYTSNSFEGTGALNFNIAAQTGILCKTEINFSYLVYIF